MAQTIPVPEPAPVPDEGTVPFLSPERLDVYRLAVDFQRTPAQRAALDARVAAMQRSSTGDILLQYLERSRPGDVDRVRDDLPRLRAEWERPYLDLDKTWRGIVTEGVDDAASRAILPPRTWTRGRSSSRSSPTTQRQRTRVERCWPGSPDRDSRVRDTWTCSWTWP